MRGLHIHGISHSFGDHQILNNVSLIIPSGELVCLLGPSGCGKTTLLRIAAGLEVLQHGQMVIDDTVVATPEIHVPPEDRKVGLMFQDYALFPHLSILENVKFGLLGMDKAEAIRRSMDVLEQVGMERYAGSHPHMLSGGQQQRVALARALAPSPRLLLLDEPFSGLDTSMRAKIREETLSVLKDAGVATMMVTHDPEEAMFMADRIKIMGDGGEILQSGPPSEIYYSPYNESVAQMFGSPNKFQSIVENGYAETPLGPVSTKGISEGTPVNILIRTEGVILNSGEEEGGVPVDIISRHLISHSSILHIKLPTGEEIRARISSSFDPMFLPNITAKIDERHTFVYPAVEKGPHNG